MVQPGRSYTATSGYRYGFNGKEKDTDINSLTAYDYGFRIYNPAIGKFLSVDPLTQSYPELTPYQFASNNPVEGIDLDGLEYVSSKEVRIQIIHGKVKLKVENMTTVVKNSLNAYNNDPKNWKTGEIGVDMSIGSISFQKAAPPLDPGSDTDPSDANSPETLPPGETKVQNPTAASTGQPDRRYKQRTVTGAVPAGARGFAIAAVATEAITYGAKWYFQNRVKKDQGKIEQHVIGLRKAVADVKYALEQGIIPQELQTEGYLSDIINVVLSGESIANKFNPEQGAKILEIGKKIYNTYSIKRGEYTGKMINTCGSFSGCVNMIQERNSNYDPEYEKAAPVTSTQKKSNE